MKKLFVLGFLIGALLVSFSYAEITADTNVAQGKAAYGTFTDTKVVTDGNIKLGATSGDITDTPQYLTVDLGKNMYVDRMKIYWDASAYSDEYVVRTSTDSKSWQEEASGLDAATGVADHASNTLSQSISLKKAMLNSRYVQVMVPAGTRITNAKGNYVKITEIEVYPAMTVKFGLDSVGVYALGNDYCIVKYSTGIGAAGGSASYGTDPNNLASFSTNSESGVDNYVTLSGLKPKTTYFYQVKASDYSAASVASKALTFVTRGDNVALNKKVTGTFTALPPKDKFVKTGSDADLLQRVTDGSMNYFNGMATSGPVPSADQYVVIDLGKSYSIKNITSFWRSLAYPNSLTIQVSSDNSTWTTLADGVDVGAGGFARSDNGDPMQVISMDSTLSGRYVKLLVSKGSAFFHKHADWDFVQLMEVKVFAD